ncbi:hypothetical protein SAMN05661010_00776 [Modicisalibacter muralis]|uniref:Lipoprotein n=1 Tax=Modicisalibacter muralis TaxID=119000 RepID=A0A1G9GMY8_9GAMM|nr:hypothetical protein [Halomonas muralis]SDL02051.1 hypothetical protein SAMN05661010_00776 [Halomonas muralis]
MLYRLFIVALSAVLLSGCFNVNTSQAPLASTYPLSEQQKMQAAHHWRVLATHEAKQMLHNPHLTGKVLFVSGEEEGSSFAQGFHSLLTSQLVSNGAYVSTNPINTARIDYRVQVVKHRDREYVRAPQGAWTALAAGIAVATIPFNHWSEPALALIPAAGLVDAFSGNWVAPSNKEVIITTQAIDGDRILYSSSNIYYINAGDSDHYRDGADSLKTISITDRW